MGAARRGLGHEVGIGQKGTGHRHHVGCTVFQHPLGHIGQVDPVRRDDGDLHVAHQLFRDPGERTTRDRGGDGRHACLVPADPRIDDRGARRFDLLGERHDLVPGLAIWNEVDHRQAIDQDEVGAHGLAHTRHDVDRQALAIFHAAAPSVGALVGMGDKKLVDEIAFASHHLDAVIACCAGSGRRGDDVGDLFFDPFLVQFLWWKRGYGRLDR